MNIVLTATKKVNNIRGALILGDIQIHSERADGTLRRRHYLTGKAYEEALWVRLQREGQDADETEDIPAVAPRTMKSIANELHMSVAAVRRMLIDLDMTETLEMMELEELEDLLGGAEEE